MTTTQTTVSLKSAHHQLRCEQVVVLNQHSLDELLDGRGGAESGIDRLAGILDSALRLPSALTVRIESRDPADAYGPEISAYRDLCQRRADEAALEAMTLRQGGIRECPRAMVLALGAAALGVISGALAQSVENSLLAVPLYALAFIAVIAAWTIGWTPIEQAVFDWRIPAHTAKVYELLARARFECVAA